MAIESGSYTPETIARRQKMAELLMGGSMKQEPIHHWAQGLAQMGRAALGGYMGYQANEDEKSARKEAIAAALSAFGGGQPDQAAAPMAPGAVAEGTPSSVVPTGAARPVQVIENGDTQPSPLDPPSGKDRDIAIRTMYGEDPGASAEGVANVMRRRAIDGNFGGNTLTDVALAKNQFEPWNNSTARARMEGLSPDSPMYKQLAGKLDRAYAPEANDPTSGATHFFAPKAQAALGRNAPSWAQGPSTTIGPHAFYGGTGQPAPVQLAGPVPSNEAPTASPQAQPPQQPPANAVASALNAPAGQRAPQGGRAGIMSALMNPWTPPALASALASQLNPSYGFQTLPDGTILRTDPKSGSVAPVYQAETKPTWGVVGETPDGGKQYGFVDPNKRKVEPYNAPGSSTPTAITGADGKPIQVPPGVDPKEFRKRVTESVADAAVGKKTEVQAKDEKFANKMELAEYNIGGRGTGKSLESEAAGPQGTTSRALEHVPVVGNYLMRNDYQKYRQARDNFITALLRDESGAAIGTEEFKRYERELFPQPGEGPEIVAQKSEARRIAIEAMKKGAGPGYKSPVYNAPKASASSASAEDPLGIR